MPRQPRYLAGLDSLVGVFDMQRTGNHLRFTVAATANLLTHHLPVAVETFTRAHPDIHLNLRAGVWTELIRLVEQGLDHCRPGFLARWPALASRVE